MRTTGKEFFYAVPGLLVPRQSFVNDQIMKDIEQYINVAQLLADSIKENAEHGRTANLTRNIHTALSMFNAIYARNLATTAEGIMRAIKRDDKPFYRKLIAPFIPDMLSLSISLQLALETSPVIEKRSQSAIEFYTEIIHNLSAIEKLVDIDDYDTALSILKDMENLESNEQRKELTANLRSKYGVLATTLLQEMREEYTNKILKSIGSEDKELRKIITVDDNPEILTTIGNVLKGYYKVFAATSGKAALKILEKQKPNLLLLDIDMPEMDGFELAKSIRSKSEFVKTPIIFLTSNSSREYVLNALTIGGNDFIVKPVNKDTLHARISHHLQ